ELVAALRAEEKAHDARRRFARSRLRLLECGDRLESARRVLVADEVEVGFGHLPGLQIELRFLDRAVGLGLLPLPALERIGRGRPGLLLRRLAEERPGDDGEDRGDEDEAGGKRHRRSSSYCRSSRSRIFWYSFGTSG